MKKIFALISLFTMIGVSATSVLLTQETTIERNYSMENPTFERFTGIIQADVHYAYYSMGAEYAYVNINGLVGIDTSTLLETHAFYEITQNEYDKSLWGVQDISDPVNYWYFEEDYSTATFLEDEWFDFVTKSKIEENRNNVVVFSTAINGILDAADDNIRGSLAAEKEAYLVERIAHYSQYYLLENGDYILDGDILNDIPEYSVDALTYFNAKQAEVIAIFDRNPVTIGNITYTYATVMHALDNALSEDDPTNIPLGRNRSLAKLVSLGVDSEVIELYIRFKA